MLKALFYWLLIQKHVAKSSVKGATSPLKSVIPTAKETALSENEELKCKVKMEIGEKGKKEH